MLDPIAGWRVAESEDDAYDFSRAARSKARERAVLMFVTLIALTCTTLTGAVAAVFLW
ncbi:hypothetical protein [Reyranella sp.]|jgi:hypothetical protein|uniref:hypothetical protein n=1 Tax=Reyranella sp. TaxID=1929291 RepID=UPI002F93D903